MIFGTEQLRRTALGMACALAIVAATSCSLGAHATMLNRYWPCLTDTEAEVILPAVAAALDAESVGDSSAADDTRLVEKSCHQRVYARKGNQLQIVKSRGRFTVGSVAHGTARSVEQSMMCLSEAVEYVSQLHFADGETIVKTYRERFPQRWSDLDRGPVTWLDCGKERGPAYSDSIAIFLHETTHDLRRGHDCPFVPNLGDNTCFDFGDRGRLPRPSAVRLSDLGSKEPDKLRRLQAAQNAYLYAWAVTSPFPAPMFDELNAYTITAETMTAELHEGGVSVLYDADKEKRNGVFLPMFMIYAVKYLAAVKAENQQRYEEEFAKGTKNRQIIDLLLARAEKAYVDWTVELKRVAMPPKDFEDNLWRQYLAMKTEMAS